MIKIRPFVAVILLVLARPMAADFPGWQGMRIIQQQGRPAVLHAADLNSDGRDELIVVNSRHSRLDIYRWLPEAERTAAAPAEKDRHNDLPMAPDFKRDELQLPHLPHDLVVKDLDGDGKPELIVLVRPPNRIVVYEQDGQAGWRQRRRTDLLPGEIAPLHNAMMLRRTGPGEDDFELLISFADGIQRLSLQEGKRADWLSPRPRKRRLNWWLVDLDGDGDQDLVERPADAKEVIRWYECSRAGRLMPAEVLSDRAVNAAVVLGRPGGGAQFLLLDGTAAGLLRRFEFGRGKASPLGRRQPLGLMAGVNTAWCGIMLKENGQQRPALVVADSQRPRLLTHTLTEDGWQSQQSFPSVSGVRAVAVPAAEPGTLLLWAKDAGDLHRSRWDGGRLTYPEPWPQSPEVENRKILALAQVGSTTWWVQKVGDDLDLYLWWEGQQEPTKVRFGQKIGAKAEQVMWLAGERLLVKDTYARSAKLAQVAGGKTTVSQPAHVKDIDLAQLKLLSIGGRLRLARLADGVLQWLGEDLHSVDQIMLAQGQKLIGYVAQGAGRGWAIQEGGQYIHRLESDDAGVAQVTQSFKLPGGTALVDDAVLGLMLADRNRVTKLSQGQPNELKLLDSIDNRIGRPSGLKEAAITRLATTDIDGDGRDEVVLFDDRRHQLTTLALVDGKLGPQISWPVFDDKTYPYSSDSRPPVAEPRAVVALDLDGDRRQDLAMICHDRLILYLARDEPSSEHPSSDDQPSETK